MLRSFRPRNLVLTIALLLVTAPAAHAVSGALPSNLNGSATAASAGDDDETGGCDAEYQRALAELQSEYESAIAELADEDEEDRNGEQRDVDADFEEERTEMEAEYQECVADASEAEEGSEDDLESIDEDEHDEGEGSEIEDDE